LEVDLPPEILSTLASFSINEDAKTEIAELVDQASSENRD
jgi:hypothetical protein